MESRVKLFGHPVHSMMIIFPLGLLTASVIFDILYLMIRRPVLAIVSFYMTVSGVVGGLLAAIFGLMDWLALPHDSRAKKIRSSHGLSNFFFKPYFCQ